MRKSKSSLRFLKSRSKNKGVSCKKGCYYCCEQNVDTSLDEAILLYEAISEEKIPVDWDKIERQSKFDGATWHTQPREDWACPLLNDETKECSVYKYRPYACRKYLVFTDPKECNTEIVDDKSGPPPIGRLCVPEAEIASCGAWNAVDDIESLPKQLLKARRMRSESNTPKNKDTEEQEVRVP